MKFLILLSILEISSLLVVGCTSNKEKTDVDLGDEICDDMAPFVESRVFAPYCIDACDGEFLYYECDSNGYLVCSCAE